MENAYNEFLKLLHRMLDRKVALGEATTEFDRIKAGINQTSRRSFQECFANTAICCALDIDDSIHFLGEQALYDGALDLQPLGLGPGFIPVQFKSTTSILSTFWCQNKYPGSLFVFAHVGRRKVMTWCTYGSALIEMGRDDEIQLEQLDSREDLVRLLKRWMPKMTVKPSVDECLSIFGSENIDGDLAEKLTVELLNLGCEENSHTPFDRTKVHHLPFDAISGETKSVQIKSLWTYHNELSVRAILQRTTSQGTEPWDVVWAPRYFVFALMCPMKRRIVTLFVFRRTELAKRGILKVEQAMEIDGVQLAKCKGRNSILLPIPNRVTFLRGEFARNFVEIDYEAGTGMVTSETVFKLARMEICGGVFYEPEWLKQQIDLFSTLPTRMSAYDKGKWTKQLIHLVMHARFHLEKRGCDLKISQRGGDVDFFFGGVGLDGSINSNKRKVVTWLITFVDVEKDKVADFSKRLFPGKEFDEGAVLLWSSELKRVTGIFRVDSGVVLSHPTKVPVPWPISRSSRCLISF